MVELLGTILSSSLLFVLFRLFPKYKIDTFQAIVSNYFVAFICGVLVVGKLPVISDLYDAKLLYWTILIGIMCISLFVIMGYSSQQNGVDKTSVAVKMSLALTVIVMAFVYKEIPSFWKIIGFIIAIAAILLISIEKKIDSKTTSVNYYYLIWLFVGSSFLDFLLSYVREVNTTNYSEAFITAFGFLFAGLIGVFLLIIGILRKKITFSSKSWLAGIVLGIPNYFSIYFLIRSYSTCPWDKGIVLCVMNIGVVTLTALFGIILFKESTKIKKIIGLLCALLAIVCLVF